MALTATYTDNQDGSGILVTLAGTGGAPVNVYYTPADRPWPLDPWIPGGTRTGDGTVTIAAPPRYYFAYATIPSTGETTPPACVVASIDQASVATRAQDAVVAWLKLCNLPRVGDRVYDQVLADPTEYKYPCVAVFLENLSEGEETSTNATDDIVYPHSVVLLDSGVPATKHAHRAWVQACRQAAGRALRNVHLAGVPESVIVRVQAGLIAQRWMVMEGFPKEAYAGGFTVRVTCREPRGLGA